MGLPWSIRPSARPDSAPATLLPLHTLFAWSPAPDNAKLFHDAPTGAVRLAKTMETSFRVDATGADPSFASLAIDIPRHIRESLTTGQILRMDATVRAPRLLTTYARLNLRHGPDTDAIPRAIPEYDLACFAEFDLSTTAIGIRPLQHLWMDLIFERPGGAAIDIADLTISVRPRATC